MQLNTRPPTLAKITRPKYSEIFPRKRLFGLLDKIPGRSVIWVTGPPGAGKTILVSSYVDFRALPCLWYQIDKGDADIATFFYYMRIVASRGSPRKKPLPLLTPEYMPGLSTFTNRWFEGLYSRLKTPSLIVFDNFQDVPSGSPFHEVMRNGFEAIPEGIKVIVISRREPPAEFAGLRANNLLDVIGRDKLKFSMDESAKLMRLKLKKKGRGRSSERYMKNQMAGRQGLSLCSKRLNMVGMRAGSLI
jgi:ATP/maltotriose-dependent transcriptional regulator MalT